MNLREYILTEKIKDNQYTYKKLAEELGINPNVLHRWIAKKCIPNTKYVYAISKITGGKVTIDDWITE